MAQSKNNKQMTVQVTVRLGRIEGEKRTAFDGRQYYSFEGIPYAKPPIGKLRFRDPQPPEPWPGVKDCTKPGNKCAQMNPLSRKGFEGSEDCLYLNVYTPSLPVEKLQKLPVLFFVHGGRLTFGYGDYYHPDYFLRHDVILVTINYRLGILGFLSLDTPEVPGNAGLKDCAVALRWVKDNIEVLNGDANNVTVCGESAGAAIVANFLTSKMTAGLFLRLIIQSGNSTGDAYLYIHDHVEVARRIAANLGEDVKDKAELYNFLQQAPVENLVTVNAMTKPEKFLNPLLMPVIEKRFPGVESFMDEAPINSFRTNNFMKVPIIAGSSSYEGAAFVYKGKNGIKYERDLTTYVPAYMYLNKSDPKCLKIANSIKEYYFKNKEINDDTKMEYIQMISDACFNRDVTNFAEIYSKSVDKFYSYKFKFVGSLNLGIMNNLGVKGSTHGDSMQYQFFRKNQYEKSTQRDRDMIDFFSEAWTSFAKNGKPTWCKQKVEWKPYNTHDKLTLVIDDDMRMERNEDWERVVFWNKICGDRARL